MQPLATLCWKSENPKYIHVKKTSNHITEIFSVSHNSFSYKRFISSISLASNLSGCVDYRRPSKHLPNYEPLISKVICWRFEAVLFPRDLRERIGESRWRRVDAVKTNGGRPDRRHPANPEDVYPKRRRPDAVCFRRNFSS